MARYEGEWYPAQICQDQNNTELETIRLSFMAIRGMNVFQWPDKEDIFDTPNEDILINLSDLIPVNNRGFFSINHRDLKIVNAAMVLFFSLQLFFSNIQLPIW